MSFKLNNADFPPLPFPFASKNLSPVSASLPFITARKPFSRNINIRSSKSFAIATNTPTASVPRILQSIFFPKLILNPSKLSISDLGCNIPIKHNHWSICKSFQSFQPVVVNVNAVSVPVRHRFHVVKSVFRHQHVCSLAKPLFLTVDTLNNTLNVCNVVTYVSSTYDTGEIFPSTRI